METLVTEVQESSSMSVLDGSDVVYVARVPTRRRIMTVSIAVGTRFPAHATSMGRVLLAELGPMTSWPGTSRRPNWSSSPRPPSTTRRAARIIDRIRRQGYAVVDQELEEGLRSVAAPVRAEGDRVVAAVNVSVHASRATVAEIEQRLLPPLLDAVARISADLGSLGSAAAGLARR